MLVSVNFYSQDLKYRDVDYYFAILKKMEKEELKEKGLLDKNSKLTEKYKVKGKESLNKEGQKLYFEVRMKLVKSYFKDYYYQQHLEYKGDVYVLYFSMAGFDDIGWCILKWKKGKWNNIEKIDKQLVQNAQKTVNKDFKFICFNYDEGPKNTNNVKIFIKRNYLVMERGSLYHSLFDLQAQKVLVNETCPYCKSKAKNREQMNIWIKKNIHDKIAQIIEQ